MHRTTPDTPPDAAGAAAPTTGALFRGFLSLGPTGSGGVLPLASRALAEDRRWLARRRRVGR